ncbi:NACHT domain-containing protein [Pseudomonas sp. nanlin1]|uniref:NACHT domain-containing protein n=1 Tax=Pseudomonas sp. nanlin1 TaxID=3040605 RepID=UPI00388EE3E8
MSEEQQAHKIDEQTLIDMRGPRLILGEPGMGKTELIREIGRRLKIKPITATRFMHHASPEALVRAGEPLLIDGLDEAMARREGDAVDLILSKLEEAGSPDFILSCRAREWQSRHESNILHVYSIAPKVLVLEALSRMEAEDFLKYRHSSIDASNVLSHLDAHGVSDLYRNPLTLGLIGRVAESGQNELPQTRAALFDRVCRLLWPEHDADRQERGLGAMTEEQALSAAGAISAGMLLAGADAVSLAGPLQLIAGDVRLVDLIALPGGAAGKAILSSKLFQTIDIDRAAPIHRVIAEFLGARWLAQEAKTSRAHRRLLRQLNGSGNVPSSLRGLHAWIAYHSASMANAVITADPFAVLRYGDASKMTTGQVECMWDALNKLASDNPYFRTQDWGKRVADGLMHPTLTSKIQTLIVSANSNTHLRLLLLEGLKGTQLAGELASTLESITYSTDHSYKERVAAAAALIPYRERLWWRDTLATLIDQCTDDSARLARDVMQKIECDVTDEMLITILLTSMGLTRCALPRTMPSTTLELFHYARFGKALPIARVHNLLDLLSDFAITIEGLDNRGPSYLAELIIELVIRTVDEKKINIDSLPALWNWLGAVHHLRGFESNKAKALRQRFAANEPLRRAIQLYALLVACPENSLWSTSLALDNRMVGLTCEDILWRLEEMRQWDNQDFSNRENWCDLIRLGFHRMGMSEALCEACSGFLRDDEELQSFIDRIKNPQKPSWQLEQERDVALREEHRLRAYQEDRLRLTSERFSLRAGELSQIVDPAIRYLGLEGISLKPLNGLGALKDWLGDQLSSDALAGFEAVLHRDDLPSPSDVAKSFIDRKFYNFSYAIMAGLLERDRSNRPVDDLAIDTRTIGLLLCLDEGLLITGIEVISLREKLLRSIISDEQGYEVFAKLWLQPALLAGSEHIHGMHHFFNEECWRASRISLSQQWLMYFTSIHSSIEGDLIDCLACSGNLTALAAIAQHREKKPFRDQDQLLTWLAVDVLTRFDSVTPQLSDVGINHPEFIWQLRAHFSFRRRGSIIPVSVEQAKWIIEQFRLSWPFAEFRGADTGTESPYEATSLIRLLIDRIANDTSPQAIEALNALIAGPNDGYSNLIRYMAAQQSQAKSEKEFAPLAPQSLGELLTEGPPSNAEDLKSLVMEELAVAQKILLGDELDQVRDFWQSGAVPFDENRCRDRLAALIKPELERYEVRQLTEADMPNTKRVDLAFACGAMQLPMEVKGQWHPDVWDAATRQLDKKYLIDWRSGDRGIYCVFWFGDVPLSSGRRLRAPPAGVKVPVSANEMKVLLTERIPEIRRSQIDVVVLDLTAGKRTQKSSK